MCYHEPVADDGVQDGMLKWTLCNALNEDVVMKMGL